MVWYGMVWKISCAMIFKCYSIRCLCYAMVYVVKDNNSATVYNQQTGSVQMFYLILQKTQKNKKQQHTFVIIFNSYNQLYNMQYSKV